MAQDPQQVPSHRYVTTENIHAGDVILEEEPWMWSLLCFKGWFENGESARTVCHYCLLSPGKLRACSACKLAWYCGPECQRADWTLRHKHGDCRMQDAVRSMTICVEGNTAVEMYQFEFLSVIRRLLLSSASSRLFDAKQRDQNGDPDSPLWHALWSSPSSTDDWVDADRKPSSLEQSSIYGDLVRMTVWKDLPGRMIEKRVLPSLVSMYDYGCWKTLVQSTEIPSDPISFPKKLALGACLEMLKFPNNCNPNAVLTNEGRLVRMIALEDIPDLDAVRLTRAPGWVQPRYMRRTKFLYANYGFDCYCARCCAGDSGEATLFALRCPKWAARRNPIDNTSSGCDGIVTGLRRTDIEKFATVETLKMYHGEIAAVVDDPRPLSSELALKPAHERAECQKCHARYDQQTLDYIIRPLTFLTRMSDDLQRYGRYDLATCERRMALCCNTIETYVHPTNFAYSVAENVLFVHCRAMSEDQHHQLDVYWLKWMQRHARLMLARIESGGFEQIDLYDLFAAAGFYGYYVHCLGLERRSIGRSGGGDEMDYERAAGLLVRVMSAAKRRIRSLLFANKV